MFKNMKLRYRFLLGYSVPILLFIIVATVVYANAKAISRQSELTEAAHANLDRLKDVRASANQVQNGARGYMLIKSDSYLKAVKEGDQLFQQSMAFLENNVTDQRQVETLNKVNEKVQAVIAYPCCERAARNDTSAESGAIHPDYC